MQVTQPFWALYLFDMASTDKLVTFEVLSKAIELEKIVDDNSRQCLCTRKKRQ